MSREPDHHVRIDRFFAGPGARADQWCNLMEVASAWTNGTAERVAFEAALAEMEPTEEFHAYPGHKLLAALREHGSNDDAHAAATLCRRITRSLLTRSFRRNAGDWSAPGDGDGAPAALHPAFAPTTAHRPYFEVLIVTGAPAARWPGLAAEWRRLRRSLDAFIYEPVFVVPGQVITRETIDFMRKLDVKEIHGYDATEGLKLVRAEALAKHAEPAKRRAA